MRVLVATGDFPGMTHLSIKALRFYRDQGLLESTATKACSNPPTDRVEAVIKAPDAELPGSGARVAGGSSRQAGWGSAPGRRIGVRSLVLAGHVEPLHVAIVTRLSPGLRPLCRL